jgi:hypothetical protein
MFVVRHHLARGLGDRVLFELDHVQVDQYRVDQQPEVRHSEQPIQVFFWFFFVFPDLGFCCLIFYLQFF